MPPGSAALRRFFRGRAAGGFAPAPRCARGSVSGQAATPLRAAASPPGLPSAPPLPPLLAPLRLALGRLVPALPGARLRPRLRLGRPRSPWGAALFPRVAARFARPRCAPLPAPAGCGGCLVARPPPYAPPLPAALVWRFRRAGFPRASPAGTGVAICAADGGAGFSRRLCSPADVPPGACAPFSAVAKSKKNRPRQPIHQLGKTTRRYKYLLDAPKIKQKILLFCLIFCISRNHFSLFANQVFEDTLWIIAAKRPRFCGTI